VPVQYTHGLRECLSCMGVGDVCGQSVIKQTLRRPYIPDGWLFLAPYDVMYRWRRPVAASSRCGRSATASATATRDWRRNYRRPGLRHARTRPVPVQPVLRRTAQYPAGPCVQSSRPAAWARSCPRRKSARRHASAFNLAAALPSVRSMKTRRRTGHHEHRAVFFWCLECWDASKAPQPVDGQA